MLEFSRMTVMATSIMVALALLCYVVVLFSAHASSARVRGRALAGVGARQAVADDAAGAPLDPEPVVRPPSGTAAGRTRGMAWFASRLIQVAVLVLFAGLVTRTVAVGHAPFANQYEFAVSFAWGMLTAYAVFEWRYRVRALALVVLPVTLAMLLYADTVSSEAVPLVPALQNHLLLSLHVATAALSYGAYAVSFGAAVLYLLQPRVRWSFLPRRDLLDEIGYRATVVGFPLLTIMIVLGSIWAEIAWGSYWSWDPKETAALVTWLVYGGFLHARVVRGWRGERAAWLLVLGFSAVMFTYFGNLFLGGLHSYA